MTEKDIQLTALDVVYFSILGFIVFPILVLSHCFNIVLESFVLFNGAIM